MTFGLFVCFDIVFTSPAVDLVKAGVRHFPYSVAMNNIIGTGSQRVWSFIHQTNILVRACSVDGHT